MQGDDEQVLRKRVVLYGNAGWGKSALCIRKTEDRFEETYDVTIGVEFCSSQHKVQDTMVKLGIFDTAGKESFRSIARSYLRDSGAVIIPFDMSVSNFILARNWLYNWIIDVKNSVLPNTLITIALTKCDLVPEEIESKKSELDDFLKEKFDFEIDLIIETSAKSGTGVTELFDSVAAKLLHQKPLQESQENGQSCEFNMLTILFYAACTLTPLVGWGCLFYELFNYLESLELFSCNSSAKTDQHNLSMR